MPARQHLKLNYKKLGQGAPLIILHGLFGMLDNWLTLGKRFAETFEVYLVDQRNHGKSPHCDSFSYAEMASDLLHFIQDHHLRGVRLIGHSMGAKTIMEFAAEHAYFIDRMICADMGPKKYHTSHGEIIDAMKALNLETIQTRKEADEALSAYISSWPVRQFLLKNLYWKDKKHLTWKFNLKGLDESLDELTVSMLNYTIDVNTLFIYGGKSKYILPEDIPEIKQTFPNSSFKKIEHADHWLHADEPEEFYSLCMDFLEG